MVRCTGLDRKGTCHVSANKESVSTACSVIGLVCGNCLHMVQDTHACCRAGFSVCSTIFFLCQAELDADCAALPGPCWHTTLAPWGRHTGVRVCGGGGVIVWQFGCVCVWGGGIWGAGEFLGLVEVCAGVFGSNVNLVFGGAGKFV
jgi:hypothetical protein